MRPITAPGIGRGCRDAGGHAEMLPGRDAGAGARPVEDDGGAVRRCIAGHAGHGGKMPHHFAVSPHCRVPAPDALRAPIQPGPHGPA